MCALAAGILALGLAGCKKETKITEAGAGEPLATMFFEYTVNDAYTETTLAEKTTYEGYQFLVVDLTVKNAGDSPVTMSDADFWISWGEGEYDFDAPISAYGEDPVVNNELESVYELDAGLEKRGSLVFIVPSDKTEFGLKTEDYYSTSESSEPVTGDVYTVSFTIGSGGRMVQPQKSEE